MPGRYWILTILACLNSTLLGQAPSTDVYSGLTAGAAKAKFEQTALQLRMRQRGAAQQAASELAMIENAADNPGLSPNNRQALAEIRQSLNQTHSLAAALEFALQARQSLEPAVRQELDRVLSPLLQHMAEYQKCKLQYQPVLGGHLAARWPQLSLDNRRCEVSDYLSLSDERPVWLLRTNPLKISELVPQSAWPAIDQYATRRAELVAQVQAQLQTQIDKTLQVAHVCAQHESLSEASRQATNSVIDALEKPYGRGLRGILLCLPTDDLPAQLKAEVGALLDAYLQKLGQARSAHEQLLQTLATRLESGMEERLAKRQFAEQLALDIYVANLSHLVQPVRVLAKRTDRVPYHEDARLLGARKVQEGYEYQVEFLIDHAHQWMDVQKIRTRALGHPRMLTNETHPTGGPGVTVSEETDLTSGQVYAHSPAGWKPVVVVDESPLGVIYHWHGAGEPIPFYSPREQLMIVPSN